ncbi:MAG: hypothetical protein EOR99_32965, partial [Mesorhizobium sp.]
LQMPDRRARKALASALRARLSGICNPVYVLDLPDGGGKVPLGPSYVEAQDGESWRIRGQDGEVRAYMEICRRSLKAWVPRPVKRGEVSRRSRDGEGFP